METQTNRRNFIQKAGLIAGGLFSARFVSASSSSSGKKEVKPSNETLKTIHDLYTTHGNFSNKEVPQEEVEKIKQASIKAANASNMQTYTIIEIRDKELMKNVCQYTGSAMLLFCVDYNRLIASANSLGLEYHPGHISSFITGSINTAMALQTAVIAARSMGIDTLTTNGIHRGNMDRHWELLGLPEKHCMPLMALVLGYTDKKPESKKGRLNGKEIFQENTYQKLTKEELKVITAQYDDPEKHLALNPGFKDQGHEHYLEWLFKEWLGSDSQPKEKETALFKQLKKRGFVEMI